MQAFHALQVDNIFVDNDGLAASAAEQLSVDLSLFLTNVEGLPWESTSFGQKEQKDTSTQANGTTNTPTASAWLHSSVQSGSAGSADSPVSAQHPSIISTYCPQVLALLIICTVVLWSARGAGSWPCFLMRSYLERTTGLSL